MNVLGEAETEARLHAREWAGEHPADGVGGPDAERAADTMRSAVAQAFAEGRGTWRALLMAQVLEAFASRPEDLRAELLSVAGMAICWVRDLDRRAGSGAMLTARLLNVGKSGG